MKYYCKECDSKFDDLLPKLESVVKGELIRVNNSLEKPCCPDCMKNALNELEKAVQSLQ